MKVRDSWDWLLVAGFVIACLLFAILHFWPERWT